MTLRFRNTLTASSASSDWFASKLVSPISRAARAACGRWSARCRARRRRALTRGSSALGPRRSPAGFVSRREASLGAVPLIGGSHRQGSDQAAEADSGFDYEAAEQKLAHNPAGFDAVAATQALKKASLAAAACRPHTASSAGAPRTLIGASCACGCATITTSSAFIPPPTACTGSASTAAWKFGLSSQRARRLPDARAGPLRCRSGHGALLELSLPDSRDFKDRGGLGHR
jgi:hypothetical protein